MSVIRATLSSLSSSVPPTRLVPRVVAPVLRLHALNTRTYTVASEKPVSDTVKEDESKLSGIPEDTSSSKLLANTATPQLFSLSNRTTIVTGGGRGLGLTIVQSLLESGSHVIAVDLLLTPATAWSHSLSYAQSKDLTLTYHPLDVTSHSSVTALFNQLFSSAPQNAPVRGLFCSAGIQLLKPALDYSPEQFRKILDVNITGSFLCAQAFAKEYIERNPAAEGEGGVLPERVKAGGGASIVMTGSMSGHVANFGLECAAYNASKAGVNQLGRNLAMEWGKKGIRVNTLSPGYIRTAMTADLLEQRPDLNELWLKGSLLGRLSTPDEFRGPVVFLLSDASSFMTGADIIVDGGHTAT